MARGGYLAPGAEEVAAARRALAAADPAMARVDALVPPLAWRVRPDGFLGLAKLVIYQQVSTASADAIWGRLEAGLGEVTPQAVLAGHEADLLPYGLSRPKARYIHALARSGFDFEALKQLPDEEAVAALTGLLGIGRWTAEAYLMFGEGRMDLFPAADIALQEAIRWADAADARPNEKQACQRAEAWRPWRSVAAQMLWACYRVLRSREAAPA